MGHVPQPTAAPEEWRPVVGYEGFYAVSSFGRVMRVPGKHSPDGRILKDNPPGVWHRVALSAPGRKVRVLAVHTLVLEAFVGPRPRGFECIRADEDLDNNRRDNLAWGRKVDNPRRDWPVKIRRHQKLPRFLHAA